MGAHYVSLEFIGTKLIPAGGFATGIPEGPSPEPENGL